MEKTRLLMVDDNPVDRSLFVRALRKIGVENEIDFFDNGGKLIQYLKDNVQGPHLWDDSHHPFLILLDLNMPVMDGREALKIIKKDTRLSRIPVVVLTSSNRPDDIDGSYKDGANTVFTKPMDFNEIVALMDSLKSYWLQKAQWPFSVS